MENTALVYSAKRHKSKKIPMKNSHNPDFFEKKLYFRNYNIIALLRKETLF